MRDALDELGEAGGEAEIAFFAGIGEDEEAVLLGCGEGPLYYETQIAIDLGQAVAEGGDGIAVEDGELGGLDGLDVETGGLLPVEALKVRDPPVLDGELGDLLDAVIADEVHAETALEHKIIGRADLLLPENEFLFFDLFMTRHAGEQGSFMLIQGNIFPNVGNKWC